MSDCNKKIFPINLDDKYIIDTKGTVYHTDDVIDSIISKRSSIRVPMRHYINNQKVVASFNDLIKATYYNHDAVYQGQMLWVYWQLRKCQSMYISDDIYLNYTNEIWLREQGIVINKAELVKWDYTKGKAKKKIYKRSYLLERSLI